MRKVFLLTLFLLSSSLFSHDPNSLTLTESKELLEQAINKLKPESLVKTSAESSSTLELNYKGQKIYLDRSIMLRALSDIYKEISVDLTSEQKIIFEQTKQSIFSYLSQKTITIAKTPFLFFKDLIFHLPEHLTNLKLALPKYYHSRGAAALVVIGVTQVAWESLETAISWAIGAGGAHAYCVVFNIALLKAVDNAKGLFQFLTARGVKLSPAQRLRLFVLTLKRDWRDGKGILKTLEKSSRSPKLGSMSEVSNQFGLNRIIRSREYHQISLVKENFRVTQLREMNISNRLWHSYQINLGVEYLSYLVEEHISSFTEEGLHDFSGTNEQRKEIYRMIWKLKAFEGKLIKFKEGLKFAISASMFDMKTDASKLSLVEYYRQYVDLVQKMIHVLEKEPLRARAMIVDLNKELTEKFRFIKKTTYSFSTSSCLRLIF